LYPTGIWSRRTADLSSYRRISVSADGNSLVAAREDSVASIWLGDASGENARRLVPSIPDHLPSQVAWAGRRLLYTTVAEQRDSIMSLDPNSGRAADEFISPALSPSATADGGVTVFFKPGDNNGIWKADANGRNLGKVVQGAAFNPQVTPDGRWVLFQRSGGQPLWIVPTDGGIPRQVTNDFVMGTSQISSDSRSLLFPSLDERNQRRWTVCQLPACSSRRDLPVVPSYGLRWTPDGRGIAFVFSQPPNPPNLWVQPLDGSPRHQLTHLTDESRIVDFAWSHDGARLAIVRIATTSDIVLFRGLLR